MFRVWEHEGTKPTELKPGGLMLSVAAWVNEREPSDRSPGLGAPTKFA